jgi:hypothetical protein
MTGCAELSTDYPLTKDDVILVPNGAGMGTPTEATVGQLAELVVASLNKAKEEEERRQNAQKDTRKENAQQEAVNQALQSFVDISKKQGAGEVTLFFEKGVDSFEFSYTERDRLVNFLDYLARESHGRKILLLSIGSASLVDGASSRYQVYGIKEKKNVSNKIQLSVARAKAPLEIIEKYLVNIPHQTYDAYGVGVNKESLNKTLTLKQQEMYQHVRIIAAFEKSDLPLLPK